MKLSFEQNEQTVPVELTPAGSDKTYRVTIGEQTFVVEILQAKDGKLELLVDGERVTAYISSDSARRWVTIKGQTVVLTKSSGSRRGNRSGPHAAGELTAPMPGQVRAVNVGEGDLVTKGQTLLVLEAMKMEIRVQAPRAGRITKVLVKHGQTVEREQTLIDIEES